MGCRVCGARGVVAVGLLALASEAAPAERTDRLIPKDAAARSALQRVRQFLGLEDSTSIRSLSLDGRFVWRNGTGDRLGLTFAPPDGYQRRTGRVWHTVAGNRFWQNRENPAPILRLAEARTRQNFLIDSIVFLASAPSGVAVEVYEGGVDTFAGQEAQVLRFAQGSVTVLRLMVDRASGRPLGYKADAEVGTASGGDATSVERVVRFTEYDRVNGIRVPSRIQESIGEHSKEILFDRPCVNVPSDRALFRGPDQP